MTTKTEPVLKEIRKARRTFAKTPAGQLEALLAQQTFWKRRATIAANKLAWLRTRIEEFAAELAKDKTDDKQK